MQDGNNMVSGAVPTNNVGDQFPTNNVGDQFPTTQQSKDRILDAFIGGEQSEICGNGKYLELYEEQNKVSKQLEERAENENLRDIDGSKLYFSPDKLEFDGDVILYKPQILRDFPHLFIRENGTFKEVSLLSEKIRFSPDHSGKSIIPNRIKKIKDGFYLVTLAHCENGGMRSRGMKGEIDLGYPEESYVIDKEGKIIEQIGKLCITEDKDGIHSRKPDKNNWGFQQVTTEEYNNKGKRISQSIVIFDDNMNVLFTIPDSLRYILCYCDNQVCVCQDVNQNGKYVRVENGTIHEFEYDENTQGFSKYLEEEEKRHREGKEENDRLKSLPFETRYSEINHCIIKYEGDNKVCIENDKGEKLREIGNVSEKDYINEDEPHFTTNNGSTKIKNRRNDSNILHIQEWQDGNIIKSIFINKKEPDKNIIKLVGPKRSCSRMDGKLVSVVDEKTTEIYDENLNKLGVQLLELHEVSFIYGEDKKVYLYSTYTGDKICEVKSDMLNNMTVKKYINYLENVVIKRYYTDKNNKTHLIVEKEDGTLIEVVPNPDKPEQKENQSDEVKS